ncbi:MAG: Sec-independent protein translocase protein TatB [Maricaulis sp.]|nr:Sec-independent protein translocase protein TatB [Maricaulis sp.]
MNPGIGAPEMVIVLVVALIVVGPQQLPVMLRKVGRMVGHARMMARDFQRSFDEIGRDTELGELRKEIEALKNANPISEIKGELDQTALDLQNEQIRNLKLSKDKDFLPFERKPDKPKPDAQIEPAKPSKTSANDAGNEN